MLTNLSDISYNDTDKHNRNTNYDAEILNGSDAALQIPTYTKKVNKSWLRFKNIKIKRFFRTKLYFNAWRLR